VTIDDMLPPFDFPPLGDLSEEQKEELALDYAEHLSTTGSWDIVELNPSKIIDPTAAKDKKEQSKEKAKQIAEEQLSNVMSHVTAPFDPEKGGFVVGGEDPFLLAQLGKLTPEQIEEIMAKSPHHKEANEAKSPPKEIEGLAPGQSLLDRFSDL